MLLESWLERTAGRARFWKRWLFFHCLRVTRVRSPCRTRGECETVALHRHLAVKNKAGGINSAVGPSAAILSAACWSVSSALAGKQRSCCCLFGVFFISDNSSFFSCLLLDEWHRWCVKRHVTMDVSRLLAPPLSVKSFVKQFWQLLHTVVYLPVSHITELLWQVLLNSVF